VDLARGHTCGEIARLRQRRCDSVRRALSNLYCRVGVRDQRALVAWGRVMVARWVLRCKSLRRVAAVMSNVPRTCSTVAHGVTPETVKA
jgi:hypothetical protein